jgi:hypothetical protein
MGKFVAAAGENSMAIDKPRIPIGRHPVTVFADLVELT